MQDFTSIVKIFATHFIEVWEFERRDELTHVKRTLTMFPSGLTGSLLLIVISFLMKKALEKHLNEIIMKKTEQ